jgi:hypothetical protein
MQLANLRTQNPVHVIAVVELVVKPLWDLDGLGGVIVLDDDEVVGLEEWPPHLQKIKVLIVGITMSSSSFNDGDTRISRWFMVVLLPGGE